MISFSRVESGNDHRFRRIVDDQVDAGQGFQGPDVPAFPADDPALHFIIGQGHYRNRGFRHLIRRTPLDGQGDDFPGLLVRGILGFLFHFLDQAGFVMFDFFPHIVQQFLFGFFAGEPGNPFQFHHLLVIQGIDFGLGFPQAVALFQKFFFLLFISIHLFVDVFFLLDQTPFIFAELCSSFLVFPFHFGPETVDFFLGFQQRFLLFGIACFFGFFQDLFGSLFCGTDFAFCYVFTSQISASNA